MEIKYEPIYPMKERLAWYGVRLEHFHFTEEFKQKIASGCDGVYDGAYTFLGKDYSRLISILDWEVWDNKHYLGFYCCDEHGVALYPNNQFIDEYSNHYVARVCDAIVDALRDKVEENEIEIRRLIGIYLVGTSTSSHQ